MIRSYGPIVLTGFLTLLAVCTMGIALLDTSFFRTSSFDVTIDDDSLRTTPLAETLEGFYDRSRFELSVGTIVHDLSAIRQVDKVSVKRYFSGLVKISISTRKPVVRIFNSQTAVCLSPDGTPFPYWPEHGRLPSFHVSDDLTQHIMLNPDSSLATAYGVAIQLAGFPIKYLRDYTDIINATESYVDLASSKSNHRLRLPGNLTTESVRDITQIDQWLMSHWKHPGTFEYDARFKGILVIRPTQEDTHRG